MKFKYLGKSFKVRGISQNDHIYKNIVCSHSFYEMELLKYIQTVKFFFSSEFEDTLAIDVGANIGNHSIFFRSFITKYLISIEPNPEVLPTLRENLSHNIDNFTLYDCAVGDKSSKGNVIMPKNMLNNIGAAQIVIQNNNGKVSIVTLDSIFLSWKKNNKINNMSISLIKIDVEGMEVLVLKGSVDIISKYRPHIFAEAATKVELDNILGFLHPLGYSKLPVKWGETPVYHFVYKPNLTIKIFSICYKWSFNFKKLFRRLFKRLWN